MQSKFLLPLLFFCFPLLLPAQSQNFDKIDAHARSIKHKSGMDVAALAKALSEGASTEKEKARSFFVWITDNIKYDIKTFENRKDIDPEKNQEMQMPLYVLKNKKAVCQGYSNLLIALCREAGIKAVLVSGRTKNSRGLVSRSSHAWCLVRADGAWGLIDPTWGAGDVDLDDNKYQERFKEVYFFMAPQVSIQDHFPDDPLFQLLPAPLTFSEFKQPPADAKASLTQKMSGEPRKGYAALVDSLNVFIGLDSMKMLQYAGARVLELDPENNYGLYVSGQYLFKLGFQDVETFQKNMLTAQQNNKIITKDWCDVQLALLDKARQRVLESSAVFDRSNTIDTYTNSIRSYKRAAQQSVTMIDKNMENIKKMRSGIK